MIADFSILQKNGVIEEVNINCKRRTHEHESLQVKYDIYIPKDFKVIISAVKPIYMEKKIVDISIIPFNDIYNCSGYIHIKDRSSKDDIIHDIKIWVDNGEMLINNKTSCSDNIEKFITELNSFLLNLEQNIRYRI